MARYLRRHSHARSAFRGVIDDKRCGLRKLHRYHNLGSMDQDAVRASAKRFRLIGSLSKKDSYDDNKKRNSTHKS
jgi:hypothetical protein